VQAFVRVSNLKPVKIRAYIAEPDVVVVLDPGLLPIVHIAAGLKEDGLIIVNTKKSAAQIRKEFGFKARLATVDANRIARELLGVVITNTTMVGALIKATGVVGLESLLEPLNNRFGRIADRNINAMKRAYEETVVEESRK
jgi:pyruvate ferredoxin oxidoreductase gamma subunit